MRRAPRVFGARPSQTSAESRQRVLGGCSRSSSRSASCVGVAIEAALALVDGGLAVLAVAVSGQPVHVRIEIVGLAVALVRLTLLHVGLGRALAREGILATRLSGLCLGLRACLVGLRAAHLGLAPDLARLVAI